MKCSLFDRDSDSAQPGIAEEEPWQQSGYFFTLLKKDTSVLCIYLHKFLCLCNICKNTDR